MTDFLNNAEKFIKILLSWDKGTTAEPGVMDLAKYIHVQFNNIRDYSDDQLPGIGVKCYEYTDDESATQIIKGTAQITMAGQQAEIEGTLSQLTAAVHNALKYGCMQLEEKIHAKEVAYAALTPPITDPVIIADYLDVVFMRSMITQIMDVQPKSGNILFLDDKSIFIMMGLVNFEVRS